MMIVNASNLHMGGGIQVAASFINEIPESLRPKVSVVASSEVIANVQLSDAERDQFARFEKLDVNGFSFKNARIDFLLSGCTSVFTVFGPLYRWTFGWRNIIGFAQPWIIYPNNECYSMLNWQERLFARLKFWLQAVFFKRADILVVELEHVKRGLIRMLDIPAERIHVVHNCISSIYFDESVWQPVDVPKAEGSLRLGFLGRNYIHKNTAIFPDIAVALEQRHGIKVRFYVTFTEQEWATCTSDFRAVCINVGPLSIAQCPRFYQEMDAVVFPSLLECFSATPLEAMAMERPLFASYRPFNRDICGAHAHYFDPLDPATAAQAIARVFGGKGPDPVALRAAREHAIHFSSPKERAEKYLALLMGDASTESTKS